MLEAKISSLKGESGGDLEDDLRELYIAQIQCYCAESIDEVDLLEQVLYYFYFRSALKSIVFLFSSSFLFVSI